ncbi:membrane dipeptidase-domain-containing protein [Podospora fimiseda]|uniref:Dipeptidase n=1 Tax=Podospora fimiseda TaxID=252190 RepID=A0AAN7BM81_9PEZI|nr:membrane dipeptidase-domain-containing protein [Podospora fimiseda]
MEKGRSGPLGHLPRTASRRSSRSTKTILSSSLLTLTILFLLTLQCGGSANLTWLKQKFFFQDEPKTIEERVKNILTETPLIDGHNDLAIFIRAYYQNKINNDNDFKKPFAEGGLKGHVDLDRLRTGMNGGAFWSVFWPCAEEGGDYSDGNYAPIVRHTLEQIDLMHRLRALFPDQLSPISGLTASSALGYFKEKDLLISPLGIEGLHQIGNSAAILRLYHSLGVRYATLTHNCGNPFADAALWEHPYLHKAPPKHNGVSVPRGANLIGEMNRLGVIVDLSHTSVDTMLDVLGANPQKWEGSKAPVIFSHSSVYAICPHPRNVPDEVLDHIKTKRGLVMINFAPDFISCKANPDRKDGLPDFVAEDATLAQVVKHVRYIGEKIGYDYVGFGSDFDGIERTPEGLEDVSRYPDLVAELLRQGVSDQDAAKVVGGNLFRVWAEVDAVAEELEKKGEKPLEDELEKLWGEEELVNILGV